MTNLIDARVHLRAIVDQADDGEMCSYTREAVESVLDELDRIDSLVHWDGHYPPPAMIRCSGRKTVEIVPSTERTFACVFLDNHDGKCSFERTAADIDACNRTDQVMRCAVRMFVGTTDRTKHTSKGTQ